MKTKLYLSGPMEGYENLNKAEFKKAQIYYESKGFDVVNPHNIGDAVDLDFEVEKLGKPGYCDYLLMDIANLNECDIMVLLPGFKKSFGACMEIAFALKKGIRLIHAYSDVTAELHAHIAITTVYDKLTNHNRVGEVLETVTI